MHSTRDGRKFQPFKKMYFLCLKSSEKKRTALIRVYGQAIILLINESHVAFSYLSFAACYSLWCRLLAMHCSHPFRSLCVGRRTGLGILLFDLAF